MKILAAALDSAQYSIIRVEFRPEPKLGLLVPYEMHEEFFAGRFREGSGTARYSNYRQFKTAARLVPPQQ